MSKKPRNIEEFAMALLNKRGFFVHELENRLLLEEFNPVKVDNTIKKFVNLNYLSEKQAFTELEFYVDSHPEVTPVTMRAKLNKRNLDANFLEELLIKLFEPEDQEARAVMAAKLKYKSEDNPAKIFRYLLSKGFDQDLSESIANRWANLNE